MLQNPLQHGCKPAIAHSRIRQWKSLALLSVIFVALLGRAEVYAQGGGSLRTPPVTLPDAAESAEVEEGAVEAAHAPLTKWVIDTDPGVDDAAAILWFLSQSRYRVKVLGIVTVAGNASLEDATNNALLIRNTLGKQEIPVVMGAAGPSDPDITLSSTGKLAHGPDGLWFVGRDNPQDLTQADTRTAAQFYCDIAVAHPGAKILALGPLTNLAAAYGECSDDMANYSEVVILGAAKFGGNSLPGSEFNIWQDPQAAQQVIEDADAPPIPTILVPLDVFTQFSLEPKDVTKIAQKGNAAAKLLMPALRRYIDFQVLNGVEPSVPDPVAAMYALDRTLGESWSALVKIILEPRLVRGQTVVGLTFGERVTMVMDDAVLSSVIDATITDPLVDAIDTSQPDTVVQQYTALLIPIFGTIFTELAVNPDNALFVVDVLERSMQKLFVNELTKKQIVGASVAGEASISENEPDEGDVQIFIPSLQSE